MTATRQARTGDVGATVATHLATETACTLKSRLRDIAELVPINQTLISVLPGKHSPCHCLVHEQAEQARLQQLASQRGC